MVSFLSLAYLTYIGYSGLTLAGTGDKIRARSKFCQLLLERKRIQLEEEQAREASRAASRAPSFKELALEKEAV